ncbi:uncharacterized protein BO66DRAFT_430543 [Aspergillus aculeatinus CBS 121060]|uniref:Uncharacterized protein n=1 Tax=Aspergillus aculeatinus CBS 121060 TaxID=1448322 RepID=A0ACD1H1T5_9EURO|nr:hypothetical protein BO66DRAFT_430543 [Aspergillus aculeatinus CBS 121060]RAH67560.1 hypothetical protein BO66DRAFT_430543 [Aspergillus aculeatinus CBS 121060]
MRFTWCTWREGVRGVRGQRARTPLTTIAKLCGGSEMRAKTRIADVINAIDYAIPAIEIIDSRVENWEIDLPDTLAGNGSTGGIILGAMAWLANRIAEYDIEFQARQVIMPRSCLEAIPIKKPAFWSSTFEGWGTIEFEVV